MVIQDGSGSGRGGTRITRTRPGFGLDSVIHEADLSIPTNPRLASLGYAGLMRSIASIRDLAWCDRRIPSRGFHGVLELGPWIVIVWGE